MIVIIIIIIIIIISVATGSFDSPALTNKMDIHSYFHIT